MREDILKRIKEKVHALPEKPGVYKMLDIYGNIIYIGKAKVLKNRVSSYFLNTIKHPKVQQMVEQVYDFEYIITPSELEALNLESNLIHKHQPFYNILLKDGKAFPYIKINHKDKFPTATITRKVLKDGAMYFGPYFNKINATMLLNIINNTFKLRDCKNFRNGTKRECLNYHIGTCLAPCTGKCSRDEYMSEVDSVIDFLKGNLDIAKTRLMGKMQKFAEMEMFENAIEVRECLKSIESIADKNVTGLNKDTDLDVFGFAENGQTSVVTVASIRGTKMIGLNNYMVIDASLDEADIVCNFATQYYMQNKVVPRNIVVSKIDDSFNEWINEFAGKKINLLKGASGTYKRLLQMARDNASEYLNKSIEKDKLYELKTMGAMKTLQKVMKLTSLPKRVEGYDISNLGGTHTVASMVVFVNGVPAKKHYRKFKIETLGQNDFRNMNEVLARRLHELSEGKDTSFAERPDLILIDGGPVQLEFAYNALKQSGYDIDMISLAKREEEVYLIDGTKVVLSKDNYALKLLQAVRDESHRFAITFNKSLRQKTAVTSVLENIDLLGKQKVDLLFKHFKSLDKIKSATIDELKIVNGIGDKLANNIFEYFHT